MWNAVRDFKDYVSIGICKAFLYFKMHSDHRSTQICIKWMVYMVLKNKSMMVDYGLRICGQVHVNLLHTFQWPRKYTHSPWRVFLHLRFMCFLGEGNCRRIPWLLFVGFGEHKSRPPRAELDGQWGAEISPDVIFYLPLLVDSDLLIMKKENFIPLLEILPLLGISLLIV